MRQLRRRGPSLGPGRLPLPGPVYAHLLFTASIYARNHVTPPEIASGARFFSRATAACRGDSGLQLCGDHFPSNWCCSASSVCLSLNNTGTDSVLCCPNSSPDSCQTIRPISCDISKQNASSNPDSELFSLDLSRTLGTCGKGTCCPLGYSCHQGRCTMKEETKQARGLQPAAPFPSSSAASTKMLGDPPTATITSGASATASIAMPGTNSSQQTPAPDSVSNYPSRAVLAGLFPGVIIGALFCAAIFFWLRRRTSRRATELDQENLAGRTPQSGARGQQQQQSRNISEPILDPQKAHRTHFIKHGQGNNSGSRTGPVTPESSRRRKLSPMLGIGTWDTRVPTLKEPTPPVKSRVRPRQGMSSLQYTPTLIGRSALNPAPHTPGLSVTTPSTTSVRDFLKPLSPLLPAFDRRTPRSRPSKTSLHKTPSAQQLGMARPKANTSRSRSRNSTATTISSSSSQNGSKNKAILLDRSLPRPPAVASRSPPSRHDTINSSQTVDCLLSTTTGPGPLIPSGIFTFQDQVNASEPNLGYLPPSQPRSHHWRKASKTSLFSSLSASDEGERPMLGSPWQFQQQYQRTPKLGAVPESPVQLSHSPEGPPEHAAPGSDENDQRLTNFTTLMYDAGYDHGSPARAVGRTGR